MVASYVCRRRSVGARMRCGSNTDCRISVVHAGEMVRLTDDRPRLASYEQAVGAVALASVILKE